MVLQIYGTRSALIGYVASITGPPTWCCVASLFIFFLYFDDDDAAFITVRGGVRGYARSIAWWQQCRKELSTVRVRYLSRYQVSNILEKL